MYLLLCVNCDNNAHACLDFDVSSALDKYQNWNATAFFCHKKILEPRVNTQLLI